MLLNGDEPINKRARIERFGYEKSLANFMTDAWPWALEPDQFLGNWHIDCMCDYLQAAVDWQLGNLLIFTLPPGHAKSLGINVFFPAWLWAQDPTEGHPDNRRALRPNSWRGPGARMIFLGYQQDLIYQHAAKNLQLIRSSWYRDRWRDRFDAGELSPAEIEIRTQTGVDRFELVKEGVQEFNNDKGGLRQALSSNGGITGFGSHIIGLDDVHNAVADDYEATRIKIIRTWDNALQSRLRDQHGVFILSMQRTAENDLIGHILEHEFDGVHVCLPYTFERKHPYLFLRDLQLPEQLKNCGSLLTKPVIRLTDSSFGTDIGPRVGEVWEDRRADDDVLWPSKWPLEAIKARTKTTTTHDYSAQYQQLPTPAEGGMFKRSFFEPKQPLIDRWSFIESHKLRCVRAWDLAWTEPEPGKDPDWTVGVLMGVDPQEIYFILDVIRARLSPGQIEDTLLGVAALDPVGCRIRIPQDPGCGKFVGHHLAKKLAGYDIVVEPEHGKKAQRAAPMVAAYQHKLLILCHDNGMGGTNGTGWNKDFIEEHCAFRPDDSHKHDDQVDAAAAAFRTLTRQAVWTVTAA
jgi:predicted phage terminase large subunit-like protein